MLAVHDGLDHAAARSSLILLDLQLLLHFQHVLLHFLGLLDHVHVHAAAHRAAETAFCHSDILLFQVGIYS